MLGEPGVWAAMVASTFDMAKTGFEVSLGLTGVMCLWLGIMRLGEKGGAVELLARGFDPLLRRLFPGVPAGHPAGASIVMNLSANMLGLDNAATPLGLKAMKELQQLNPQPDTASNDQILFLVINASAVTVIPTAIMTYRAQLGAADPTDVFLPLLIATFCSTMVGVLVTARIQKLPLGNPVTMAYLGGVTLLIGLLVGYCLSLDKETLERQTSLVANLLIFSLIVAFLLLAARRGSRSTRASSTAPRRASRSRSASSRTWWPCWSLSASCARAGRSTRCWAPCAGSSATSAWMRAGSTRFRWRWCDRSPAAARAAS
jgi:spore maturation protein SpmA